MSARQLRRSFATPFIVTLAGSSMVAACGPKPLPKHENPPGPHSNPPAPEAKPGEGSGSAEHHDHEHHDHPTGDQPAPPPAEAKGAPAMPETTISKNPPAPVKEPAKYEQKWTVMKFKGKPDCQAMVDVNCPKGEPGKPMPTCNPPPPIKYACPDGFQEGDTLKIILRAGATECFVDYGPMKCPAGAKCNPPPPRKVACPER